jgi:ankyrin repeat protein
MHPAMNTELIARLADGRTDLVFDLVAGGHAATGTDQDGVALIHWCAYYGDVSAVRYLLENGERLESLGENFNLNGAVFHGHWQLCQFLIERGADVNHPMPDSGETPLHAALCKPMRPEYDLVVELLLAAGADPNRRTMPGVETGCFMRDCWTRAETPLHRAAAFGSEKAIGMLIAAGAAVDARDCHGESPLCWASWHSRSGAVLRRLSYGEHSISDAGVAHYSGDHGLGWGGMAASLRGRPHV